MSNRNVESLSLAKALAVKNRLAGRLAQARSNISGYNSVLEGQAGENSVDVRAEYDRYLKLQEAIVQVKATIQRANHGILEDVLRLAEIKDRLKLLNELDTKSGSEPTFNGLIFTYVATMTRPEVLEMSRRLEAEVDTIQDRLNAYNATTQVEIATEVLDLSR